MILVVDNYDSFTYNLVQLLTSAGAPVEVVRNDAQSVDELLERRPRGVVLSPGPGRPENAGVCVELVGRRAVPLLGVCLGHQAIAVAFGGEVVAAPALMHGKTSAIEHRGDGLFAGLENPVQATRYHSLVVRESSLPVEIDRVAWAEDGTLQALRHRELPIWGVQFHPESILTPSGGRLMENFLELCG